MVMYCEPKDRIVLPFRPVPKYVPWPDIGIPCSMGKAFGIIMERHNNFDPNRIARYLKKTTALHPEFYR